MRLLLVLLVVLSVIDTGLCCGRGKKKKGQPSQPPENPQPEGDVIQRLLGPVTAAPYGAGNDQAGDCGQLKCNLDDQGSCCWTNAQPPADELEFAKGSGDPDPEKLKTNFGTSDPPSGTFFITASEKAGTSDQSAQLYSCPITCSQGDITVKLKHWQTKGTKVQVCSEQDPSGPPGNCQDLSGESGKSDSVTIPKGENVRIVIQAKGFTEETGDVAMVDDIEVECEPCVSTTTTSAGVTTTSGTATPGSTTAPPGKAPCKLACNFEKDGCAYQPSGQASDGWGSKTEIYQNRLTGVRKKSPDGEKFAACYTKKKGEKASMAAESGAFDQAYVIKYLYYVAAEGVTLKACCDDESKCPKQTDKDIKKSDYKQWRQDAVSCPAGTKKLIFVCENQDGASEGACGVDKVEVYKSCSGEPSSCQDSACPAGGGGGGSE